MRNNTIEIQVINFIKNLGWDLSSFHFVKLHTLDSTIEPELKVWDLDMRPKPSYWLKTVTTTDGVYHFYARPRIENDLEFKPEVQHFKLNNAIPL